MLTIRRELAALIAWNQAEFCSYSKTELDAIAIRILRMAELLRRMREIAERN
jgi:hypothetical protein